MKEFTENQKKAYIKHNGTVCPECYGTELEGQEIVIDNGKAFQDVHCMDCHAEWTDEYQLSNLIKISESELPDPVLAHKLDIFTRAYIECLLWASTDDETPLDENHSIGDIAPEALEQIKKDCYKFVTENLALLDSTPEAYSYSSAGHDFWLTRCGHGAGFWDGDIPENLGGPLTESSEAFGNLDPYIGDDNKIYLA